MGVGGGVVTFPLLEGETPGAGGVEFTGVVGVDGTSESRS